jgi:mannitol/fructose-specific phosphotransferase system IIA component (Ntr-type)
MMTRKKTIRPTTRKLVADTIILFRIMFGDQPELIDHLCEYLAAHGFMYDEDYTALYREGYQMVGVGFLGIQADDAHACAEQWLIGRATALTYLFAGRRFGVSEIV